MCIRDRYSTGHIHQLSLKDFKELLIDIGGLKIKETVYTGKKSSFKKLLGSLFPNLFLALIVNLVEKE